MDETRKALGGRIKEIRKRLGLNQKNLGLRLGVGISAVSAYETGDSAVAPETLKTIAQIGNVTLDWLITGKEPATQGHGQVAEEQGAYQVADEFERRILGMLRRLPEDSRNRLTQIITTVYFDYMESRED